ncbi:uncharacterized protein LOC125607208 [Brassica napus]|uniref:uncharacterized protein LOC125607208 n=1 Tax=Brassica napus TaxID=3708 RepID=UPI002078C899|nr:uncharacterized protein LOC125607208 [Brassica napus]
MEKPTMYLGGVTEDIQMELENKFHFKTDKLPVHYLGLPLTTKSMNTTDYQPLIETIRTRIGSWKNQYLSYAGRLELLGSVIWNISSVWLSAFRLPKACIREIDKICSVFLWSGSDLNPRKAKLCWEEVCRPREEGGLGLRSLKDMNNVTVLKLFGVRGLAPEFCKVEVYNGKGASFWYDQWSPLGCLMDMLGTRGQIYTRIRQHDTVHTARTKRRRRVHRSAGLIQIENQLQSLSRSEEEDVVLWKGKQDIYKDQFLTSETWNHIRTKKEKVSWHRGIWFTHATPKHRFCTWLAIRNWLTMGDKMVTWNAGIDGTCVLCMQQLETRNHLFFGCDYSSSLWYKLMNVFMGNGYSEEWIDVVLFIQKPNLDRTRSFLVRYVFQSTIYMIWHERNCRRHDERPRSPEVLFAMIDRLVKNRIMSIRAQDMRLDCAFQLWIGAVQA